ncbi:MAG: hypothetical protein D3921_15675 [Candidatus Electrothrix sp. AW1]|nr:hypothetical protein [Candidatus Electrothrix gigas]
MNISSGDSQLYERAAHPDDYFLFLFQKNYSNRKISYYAPDNRKNRTFNRTRIQQAGGLFSYFTAACEVPDKGDCIKQIAHLRIFSQG